MTYLGLIELNALCRPGDAVRSVGLSLPSRRRPVEPEQAVPQ